MAANPFASRANGCVARSTRTRRTRTASSGFDSSFALVRVRSTERPVESVLVLDPGDHTEITATRLARPGSTSYGGLELQDAEGGVAWTKPLWS